MESLSNDIILIIMLNIPTKNLLSLFQTHSRFGKISNQDYFWYLKFLHDYGCTTYYASDGWKELYKSYCDLYTFKNEYILLPIKPKAIEATGTNYFVIDLNNDLWVSNSIFNFVQIANIKAKCISSCICYSLIIDTKDTVWYYKHPYGGSTNNQPTILNIRAKQVICNFSIAVIIDINNDILCLSYSPIMDMSKSVITQLPKIKAKQVAMNNNILAILTLDDKIIIKALSNDVTNPIFSINLNVKAKKIAFCDSYLFFINFNDYVYYYYNPNISDRATTPVMNDKQEFYCLNMKAKNIEQSSKETLLLVDLYYVSWIVKFHYYTLSTSSINPTPNVTLFGNFRVKSIKIGECPLFMGMKIN